MEVLALVLIAFLMCVIFALSVKLYLLRKSAREIEEELAERIRVETNTLISISSDDKSMRQLAATVNSELRKMRGERRRFQNGDLELKEAVANISHDLRTPLTAICGYLTLLNGEEKSESVSRYLSMIKNRVEALKSLTEELFRYSVISSVAEYSYESVDLRRLLEESLVSFYGDMNQKGISPDITLPDARVERNLDPSATRRIFENIISNALKYGDGDFTVRMDGNGKIVFSNRAEALTPVTAGKLFNRFYTVEAGRNSTGLGLSIAKLLTERMGGTIGAEYRDSTLYITVRFPL